MKLRKLLAIGVCLLLVMSLFASGLVYAAEAQDEIVPEEAVTVESEVPEETRDPFQIWGTFAEAQIAYGTSWTYGVLSYNVAGGYFLCYCQKTDGSLFYFGCYSL